MKDNHRFFLLGYKIKHSLSPSIYQFISQSKYSIVNSLKYELIDLDKISNPQEFLQDKLVNNYQGMNITSPYKTSFYPYVKIDLEFRNKENFPVNCIKYDSVQKKFIALNSDYLALEGIFREKLSSFFQLKHKVCILADGAMAKICLILCDKYKLNFHHYRRSTEGDLEQYDFSNDLKQWSKENYLIVFINCCSRSVVFNQNFNGLSYFLDLNYKTIFSEKMKDKKNFEDGKRLLISQAIIAAEFFNIIRPLTLPCEKQLTDEFSQLEAEIYHYLLK